MRSVALEKGLLWNQSRRISETHSLRRGWSFWRESHEDRGWPSRCESHSLGEVDPWFAKPFSFREGDAIDANSIRSLKVGILWKNPIHCSGNPLEENSILVEEGAPLQRILFVMERGRPMMWMSLTRRREPPEGGEALSRRQPLALRRSPYSDTIRWGEGDCWGERHSLDEAKEVHQRGRTLPTSESDSHRGLEPHIAEPNLGSCWWRGPCWC